MEQNPTWASALGDRRWNDRWPDLSIGSIEKRHSHNLRVLAKLKGIRRSELAIGERLSYDLFKRDYEIEVEGHQYGWYLIPINQREGIQLADELADALRFETLADYEDWIARLRSFPAYMDQSIGLMREGIRKRMLLPRVILQRIPAQIDSQIVSRPEDSPFYRPFRRIAPAISKSDRIRLERAGRKAIDACIIPAYRKLRSFVVSEYLAASPDQVGIWKLPAGEEMYSYFVRLYTTTSMTPKEVHQVGQSEVKRIRAEMRAIIDKVGFNGSFSAFLGFLRSDPRFYYKTPEDLLEGYRSMTKRIDPQLVKIFKTLPRIPYGVEPIPDAIAPDTTTAYYREPAGDGSRAGTYFVNLYKPEARPKYEMMALSLHEAVPGHHLQIGLGIELADLPQFRRYGGYTAFVEGWGLYAESLGDELGLYDDPYSKFGRLTYEMWRAVRLVVDTGIHSRRWDRQRAIDFFLVNAAKQELDVVNEIDRYISWPGQALAYKIGELKIRELRDRASARLGDRFDLREFHEVLLGSGALPLEILEQNVDAWIVRKTRSRT